MSGGYASRLSEYPRKGICGLPEIIESGRTLEMKLTKLANLVKSSKDIVIFTGAGISTSAGIPDFRGPNGIWTQEMNNKKKKSKKKRKNSQRQTENSDDKSKKVKMERDAVPDGLISSSNVINGDNNSECAVKSFPSFDNVLPTLTHRAITELVKRNIVKYVITQNVDGLHRRSGLPRCKQSILHGCAFTEKCELCNKEYFRDFDVQGMSFQKTGRQCENDECQGDLRDTLLDWEDELPEKDFSLALEYCEKSDLIICLGTSLRIEPAGSLPLRGQKFVIVNMQRTGYDDNATLILRAKVDDVMKDLTQKLDIAL